MGDRFPSDEARAAWQRNVDASDHLARHLGEAPVLVLVLMPDIEMTVADDDGVMDVGPTYASVYPAVQNFVLAARSLGLGTVLTTVYRIHEDEVREICGIPDRYQVVALLPLGRPRGSLRGGAPGSGRRGASPAGTATASAVPCPSPDPADLLTSADPTPARRSPDGRLGGRRTARRFSMTPMGEDRWIVSNRATGTSTGTTRADPTDPDPIIRRLPARA